MADKLTERDGTSQAGRVLAALDPAYVSVDERTVEELVAFARAYGEGLTYFGEDDRPAGTWRDFVGSLSPEKVAAFLREPGKFDPEAAPELFRPHFVLFLAFLELFRRAQGELNTLTGRHLDFYYRRVLRMVKKGPVPDQVNLLFNLTRGREEVLVSAGSLLGAGPDSLGKERLYATDRDIVVNRARIGAIRSLCVEQRRTGIKDAWRRHASRDKGEAVLAMLRIALGDPQPGDPLPEYPGVGALDFDRLQTLRAQVNPSTLPEVRDAIRRARLPNQPTPDPALQGQIDVVEALDEYFCIPAERFIEAMDEITGTEARWERVFSILEDAHKEKIRKRRVGALEALREEDPPADLLDLIRHVMNDEEATEEDVAPFLGSSLSLTELQEAAKQGKWERVYSILEVALRNRLGEPRAELVEWMDLYPAEDAPLAGALPVPEEQKGAPQWATFGLARPSSSRIPAPRPVLGWAVSSPLLSLHEGHRIIKLTLKFLPEGFNKASGALASLLLEVSTAEGWVECQPEVALEENQARFTLEIAPSVAPIAAPPAGLAHIDSPWPVLRLMLRSSWSELEGRHVARYDELGQLLMVAARVEVEVKGLKSLKLQSDEAVLDAKKPFEPFGHAPAVGSRLLLGHPEVVTRKLDSLTFNLEWMRAPGDLAAHYANYGISAQFTVQVSLVDRAVPRELAAAAALFPSATATSNTTTSAAGSVDTAVTPAIVIDPAKLASAMAVDLGAAPAGALEGDLSTWRRYLQWTLNEPDFQHQAYPAVAAAKALALACAIANKTPVEAKDYQVNPPYTPKLKSLTIGYTSSQEIRFDGAAGDARAGRVFHIHPFGYCDVEAERSPAGVPLLPRYDNEGELYLGLRDLAPPQTVSILFQMAEGSADPDLSPQPVAWSYLSGDRWIPLDHRILRDTTGGLIRSGIIELALEPAAPSTRVRGDLYWIRAAVARDTESLCDTVAIETQAISATFVNRDNAPDHFRAPLPAGTIKKLAREIPGIAGVRQPYCSYGGRMAEEDATWATRVSERLRHKQRALSVWDYERLVLQRFPEIYKAKCLPASADHPGRVEVIVIPDIRNMLPFDPFAPKAPSKLLADVEAYLGSKLPAFASVKVRNAGYVAVRVHLRVRFKGEGNEGFYTRKLNDELNRFLSPWAYEEGADIVLGGRIYANSIVDFVDRRPYVDYVAGVTLWRSDDGDEFLPAPPPPQGEGDFVGTDRPDAVLVAAREHVIRVLHDAVYEEKLMTGIGFMKVELDFIVA